MIDKKKGAPVTWLLIAVNVAVFLFLPVAFKGKYPQDLVALGADYGPLTLSGQWWRVLWSSLIHVDLIHLAANMLILLFVGSRLERTMGRGNLFFIYVSCGVVGDLVILTRNPNSLSYGASAAIAGVLGAVVVCRLYPLKDSWRFRKAEGTFLLLLVLYTFDMDVVRPSDGVHTIALLAGLCIGAVLVRFGRSRRIRLIFQICVFSALISDLACLMLRHRHR